MDKNSKLIYLILIVVLNFACVEKKATEKETNIPERVATVKTDTLKFTSGIRAIFQDSKGNYWIGSHNEGVSFYNGKVFEYFTVNEGLANNQIRSIQEDEKGNIWFGTATGVSVYNNSTFTNYPSTNNIPIVNWNTTNGNLWFNAGAEDGIYRFDSTNMNYLIFPKPQTKNTDNADNTYGVTGISKGKDGKVWIATYAALFNYDGKEVTIFDKEKLNLKHNERLHIRSVLADSKGRIWIGNNGIGVLLMEGNETINFSDKHHLIHPSSKRNGTKSEPGTLEHPFAIEEDAEGNIWFGDLYTGAWKYDGKMLTNYLISNKQPHPMIWTIYKDNNNNLLFGLADGTIVKFNGKAFDKQF